MPESATQSPPKLLNEERRLRRKERLKAILISFAVGGVLLALKFLTYSITQSAAVLSDALESIINVVASAFAALSIWMAAKPPDPEHPYGHGKTEYFSAGFEGALIMIAALGVFYSGLRQIFDPQPLPNLSRGMFLLLVATLINLILGYFLVRVGTRNQSLALIADGKHILTDVFTSVGVMIGLAAVAWSGKLWLDGVVACLLGISIIIAGGRLVHQSIIYLMDSSDPLLLDRIATLLQSHRRPNWIDIHQLRAWRAGPLVHIDLHLVLPQHLSLFDAHHEAKILEHLLVEDFSGEASVLVHMDPCEKIYCPVCGSYDCDLREHARRDDDRWDRQRLTQPADIPPAAKQAVAPTDDRQQKRRKNADDIF